MIVECVENCVSSAATSKESYDLLRSMFGPSDRVTSLTIGKQYVVYAVESLAYGPLFYIADDDFGGAIKYPIRYSNAFFRVVDSRPSSYWETVSEGDGSIQTFSTWSSSQDFYERLVNGESQEVEIFSKYRKLMDFEFPWPTVKDGAALLESTWVQCPFCCEAWSVEPFYGMVQCSNCQRIMRNPTYLGPPVQA